MPIRWELLQQRPMVGRREAGDPEPLEAAIIPPRAPSMREEIARYVRSMRELEFQDVETESVRAQLRDFIEEDPDEMVLSDYQLAAMAEELAGEADELAFYEPLPRSPEVIHGAEGERPVEGPVEPGTVPSS